MFLTVELVSQTNLELLNNARIPGRSLTDNFLAVLQLPHRSSKFMTPPLRLLLPVSKLWL